MDVQKFLKTAQATWGETVEKAKSGAFENLPDGQYVMQLSSSEFTESKAGKPMLKQGFTVLEGDLQGRTHYDFVMLDGQRGLEPMCWRIQAFGYKPEDLDFDKIEDFFDELVAEKPVLKITLKTSGEFQNMRITKLLPDYESAPSYESTPSSKPATKETVEPEMEEDEEVELSVGMRVSFLKDGKPMEGMVKAIREEDGEADVRVGVKTHKVSFDDLEIVDGDLDK